MQKFEALRAWWGPHATRVVPIAGDLAERDLGVSKADLRKLNGKIDHLFHLAAIYDLQASSEDQDTQHRRHGSRAAVCRRCRPAVST
jgi:thioester reductase-like protein